MSDSKAPTIFVLSDGRGDTANRMLKAALVQFSEEPYEIVLKAEIRSREQVREAVAEAAEREATILYTLVSLETRTEIRRCADRLLVPTVDLLGPSLRALNDVFSSSPGATPGLLYESDKVTFDRFDAIDFVLKHDDGQYPHELDQADVILVGVSRVSKSSTCFYLAYEGIRAANVPLVPNQDPLPELLRIDPARVIGLKHNVNRLRMVREARIATRHAHAMEHYLDKRAIAAEVRQAVRMMDEYGWRSIDVSYMAIEEIAKRVMDLTGFRGRRFREKH